jgi:hypothetical protein
MKAPGVGSPDYAGFEPTRMTGMPTSFQAFPNCQADVNVMFAVHGNRFVPKPGLFTLAAIGVAGATTMRRRRKGYLRPVSGRRAPGDTVLAGSRLWMPSTPRNAAGSMAGPPPIG